MAINKVFSFLTSIRLFIAVLSLFSFVSLAGIIIPQNGGYDEYARQFGPGFANVITECGWNHIFYSPWCIVPLAALCVNLIFCLGRRLFFLSTVLRQDKKGKAGAAGSFLIHAGFLFLVAGGIIQYYSGDSESVIVSEGTQEFIEKYGLNIFLHDFSIIKNGMGEIINYRSTLELRDTDNNTLIRTETMVNTPLKYHGLYFYQMDYGQVPNAVKQFRAVIADSAGDTLFNGTVPYKTDYTLGKTGINLQCSDFLCDFYYDFENRLPMTRSHEHNNPAFKVTLSRKGAAVSAAVAAAGDTQWIFQKFPRMSGRFGRYSITIPSYTPLLYSGIQVQKKKGTAYILTGIISVSTGLVLVFLFPFRRRG